MTFSGGFIVVDKPLGATSFAMVSLLRRLTGVRRVGHAGTLDPLATGVLPVAIGQATRFIEYMDDTPKVYRATIAFGASTTTYDAEGETTAEADASAMTHANLTAALPSFTGTIEQVPPTFSAVKLQGQPAYRLAREGHAPELRARLVQIHSITVSSFTPGVRASAMVDVVCGKGTYIRSLAHDLGAALGVGAHLTALRRTSSSGFHESQARTPDELDALHADGNLDTAMLALDRAVERRPAAILAGSHALDVVAGRDLRIDSRRSPQKGDICRAYDDSGSFMGVLRYVEDGLWHPSKVVPTM